MLNCCLLVVLVTTLRRVESDGVGSEQLKEEEEDEGTFNEGMPPLLDHIVPMFWGKSLCFVL